ncbi:MAG: CPBP family intramembrane metalloprotease [Thiohalocapsa sp.]|nr:CPBP family intramembrane metalloprotease [Thiohalocapsa sp.]MCF7990159.1 CPBP family intramembrane metalloprotease [Thiohalocapsa sp.]
MRTTAIFFGYLFACLLLAALLTYPLMQTGWIGYEPQRVMGRLAQVFILLGLWPFLKVMGFANRATLGFDAPRGRMLRAVRWGWVLGVLILLVLVAALMWLGVRVPDPPSDGWIAGVWEKAVAALIGGLLIGLLEEAFFRGALFAAVKRADGLRAAVVWSALLYAVLHFMKPHELPEGMAFDWAGTRAMFAGVFTGVFQWQHLDSMAALFMVGVFLALVRERTGHIGWCIGLHAGWVFVIQVSRRLTDGDDNAALAFLAGNYDGVIGWLAALWIGLLAWLFWRWSGRFSSRESR